ncbi:TetR/AcrR family transcriptional regulator [Gordonia zhaorongruii]|uniref:TetR/AcrR family transcriptional regulator n=1 Tax=Gordonia zhaorongruii TaxID=2597659 RepID=UPI0010481461|nr:TetR/AcrR family transcriptional regulator [Gordonia zhaorongruii]
MGRRPKFTSDELLDAALAVAIADGPAAVTAAAVSRSVGAPSGSVYHRFPTSDDILARLWLRTITEYQSGFTAALSADDTVAGARAAISHTFDWCAAHPDRARLLLTFDEQTISGISTATAAALREHNDAARNVLTEFTRRHFGSAGREEFDRAMYAVVDLPYGAVRRHLPGGRPRPWLRATVVATADLVLGIG